MSPGEQKPRTEDAELVFEIELEAMLYELSVEIFFSRKSGTDDLWVSAADGARSLSRHLAHPTGGSVVDACRALSRDALFSLSLRYLLGRVLTPGLLAEADLREIASSIEAEIESTRMAARQYENQETIALALDLGLGPAPSGADPRHWVANCPRTGHRLEIDGSTGQFGCGYCKRAGDAAALLAFVNERRGESNSQIRHVI